MANRLLDRLRGARRIELFAALAAAAVLALILLGAGGGSGGGARKTELELRLERILSQIDGAGSVEAMINQDSEGRTTGALIVAEELRDIRTFLQLQRAVSTLLELEPERIEIVSGDGDFGGGL